jgi:hypothetical protein|tara:strand:- start:419 stop:598 length:180 start_codon:yes stop_codon:yes gene_type:complete
MGHDDITPEDIAADIKWIAELTTLENKVNSLPFGSDERLEASINLAELNEIYEDDFFGF